ncbi:unnamed protein product, partial [Fusarium graminearum]
NRAIWGRHVSCMARGTGICSVPDNVLTNGAMFGLLSRHVIHNQLETLFCPLKTQKCIDNVFSLHDEGSNLGP